jgi:AraC-like DNA-binding protein
MPSSSVKMTAVSETDGNEPDGWDRRRLAASIDRLTAGDCAIVANVIVRLLERANRDELDAVADPHVRVALRHLASNFRNPRLSLRDLAAAAGVSRCHLARRLSGMTGRSFLAHLHAMRVTESRRLLRETMLSVKEVAAQVGYNDATQFCRQFRRLCACSPRAYRCVITGTRIADDSHWSPTNPA